MPSKADSTRPYPWAWAPWRGPRFRYKFVFDPIQVIPAVDEYGDGDGELYLRIMIMFDGDQEALDPHWTSGLIRRIRPKLIEAGVEEFPVRHSWKSPNGRGWSGA